MLAGVGLRRAKMKLAIACAVLFFATLVHADTLTTVNGTIVYPNGSVITSETIVVPTSSNGIEGFTEIEFQFQDGSGFALSDSSGAVSPLLIDHRFFAVLI